MKKKLWVTCGRSIGAQRTAVSAPRGCAQRTLRKRRRQTHSHSHSDQRLVELHGVLCVRPVLVYILQHFYDILHKGFMPRYV